MQVVILAGGFGTRISEESHDKPKPMIEVGDRPILWHIMKIYSHYGYNDFIICCGYKGNIIKDYFQRYTLNNSDFSINLKTGEASIVNYPREDWNVTLVDTGLGSMTGGRLGRVAPYLTGETFLMTYGDGVSDINIKELVSFHKSSGTAATLAAVQPPGRFGAIEVNVEHRVESFNEKPIGDGGRINGGFFVLNRSVLDLIDSDTTVWEQEPLMKLADTGDLSAFEHNGFWQPMDSLRDKTLLNSMWSAGEAPWKCWED